MYTIVSAYGISNTPNSHWVNLTASNVETVLVSNLFISYRKLYITLSHPNILNNIYVDLDDLRVQYVAYVGTLRNLLDSFGSNVPPTVESIPTYQTKFARWTNAFKANYKLDLIPSIASIGTPTGVADKTRLRISRPKPLTDMKHFYESCLVSINGFYYQTDSDNVYTYVPSAGKSLLKCRRNKVGILSFANIGKIKIVPITDTMISKQSDTSTLRDRTYITVNEDIQNKTVMISIGGYLHFADQTTFFPVTDTTFAIDFNRIPILSRYYESLPYMDYSELGLDDVPFDDTILNVDQFLSDTVLTKYLKMKQSFMVILDTPQIFVSKHHLRGSALPGMFTAYSEPKAPLVVGNGRVAEYWKIKESDRWSLNVEDSLLYQRIFEGLDIADLETINASNNPAHTAFSGRGYLLEIGADILAT